MFRVSSYELREKNDAMKWPTNDPKEAKMSSKSISSSILSLTKTTRFILRKNNVKNTDEQMNIQGTFQHMSYFIALFTYSLTSNPVQHSRFSFTLRLQSSSSRSKLFFWRCKNPFQVHLGSTQKYRRVLHGWSSRTLLSLRRHFEICRHERVACVHNEKYPTSVVPGLC